LKINAKKAKRIVIGTNGSTANINNNGSEKVEHLSCVKYLSNIVTSENRKYGNMKQNGSSQKMLNAEVLKRVTILEAIKREKLVRALAA